MDSGVVKTQNAYKEINNQKFTPGGASWAKQALNLFSDVEMVPVGYPDGHGSNTVVQCYNTSTPISIDGSFSSNFNCAITFTQNDFLNEYFVPGAPRIRNTITSAGAVSKGQFGGVMITQSDATVSQAFGFGDPGVVTYDVLTLPDNLINGTTFRVVSFAMEVVNETAPINAGGSCLVWTQPRSSTNLGTWTDYFAPGNVRSFEAEQMRPPPSSLERCAILRGTEQWKAVDGAYVNARLSDLSCPFKGTNYVNPLFCDDDVLTGAGTIFMFPGGQPGVVGGPNSSPQSHMNAFDPCGIVFTGLPPQSSLMLRCRWVIESIPDAVSPLITLVKPTLSYDYRALAAVSQAQKRLPAGCKAKDNASGDWAKGVSMAIKAVSGMAVSSGNPYAVAAGAAGYLVSDLMDAYTAPPRPKAPSTPAIMPNNAIVYGPQLPKRKKGRKKKLGNELVSAGFGQSLKGMTPQQRQRYLAQEEANYRRMKYQKAKRKAKK